MREEPGSPRLPNPWHESTISNQQRFSGQPANPAREGSRHCGDSGQRQDRLRPRQAARPRPRAHGGQDGAACRRRRVAPSLLGLLLTLILVCQLTYGRSVSFWNVVVEWVQFGNLHAQGHVRPVGQHALPGLSNSILRLPTSRLKFTHRCPDSVLFSPDGPYWDTFRPVLTPDLPGLAPFWPHMTCGAQPPPHTRGEIFPFPSGRCCGLCCVVPARVPASVA